MKLKRYVVDVKRHAVHTETEHIEPVDHDLEIFGKNEKDAMFYAQRRVDVAFPGAKITMRGRIGWF